MNAQMIEIHRNHVRWWQRRIDSGILDRKQVENAQDMIRVHRAIIYHLSKQIRKTMT